MGFSRKSTRYVKSDESVGNGARSQVSVWISRWMALANQVKHSLLFKARRRHTRMSRCASVCVKRIFGRRVVTRRTIPVRKCFDAAVLAEMEQLDVGWMRRSLVQNECSFYPHSLITKSRLLLIWQIIMWATICRRERLVKWPNTDSVWAIRQWPHLYGGTRPEYRGNYHQFH